MRWAGETEGQSVRRESTRALACDLKPKRKGCLPQETSRITEESKLTELARVCAQEGSHRSIDRSMERRSPWAGQEEVRVGATCSVAGACGRARKVGAAPGSGWERQHGSLRRSDGPETASPTAASQPVSQPAGRAAGLPARCTLAVGQPPPCHLSTRPRIPGHVAHLLRLHAARPVCHGVFLAARGRLLAPPVPQRGSMPIVGPMHYTPPTGLLLVPPPCLVDLTQSPQTFSCVCLLSVSATG